MLVLISMHSFDGESKHSNEKKIELLSNCVVCRLNTLAAWKMLSGSGLSTLVET